MQLHKRFILDIWKSSAYYDFQQSFKVPDTFYLHEQKIDWIFTGKSGKILKKKQENSSINVVKDYFCKLDQNEQESESNSQMVAFQLLASYDQGICYFHYLDLSGVCELIVDSFKKRDDIESSNQICTDFNTGVNLQQKVESNLNQNVLSDKTAVIQRFQKSSCNEKNMIRTEWTINGKFTAQKRISNYESFRKEDEYKSYLIFEDENMSVNRELSQKDKQELLFISQHVVKALELIHNERGKISNIQLLLTQINGSFYLLACSSLQFSNDSTLPQPWRISYELKMKYPNQAIHMQDTLQEAQKYLKKIENNKKVQQCECCKNFSTKLQAICSNKLIQIRMRRGVGISQFEAKQLKKKDFSDICEVCYQIFLEMHKINSYNQNQQNLITENSFISKHSISILNSQRGSTKREKRSQSNYESGDKSQKCNLKSERSYDVRSYKINNYQSRNNMQSSRDNSVNTGRENSVNLIRKSSTNNLKEYSSSNTQGEQSTVNTRDYSSYNTRNSSSQRNSQRVPPLYFRITEKVKSNNQSNKPNIQSKSQSTDANTRLSQPTLNQLNSDISNQQLFFDFPDSKKSQQITNDISNPYDISEISKTVINQEDNTSFNSQSPSYQLYSLIDKKDNNFQNSTNLPYQMHENLNQQKQIVQNSKLQNINQPQDIQAVQVESDQKPIKNKFGIKIALKNLKKDVKKQQEDIKSVIQEAMKDCSQIQLKLETQQSENRRYSRTILKRVTPRSQNQQLGVEQLPTDQNQQQKVQSQSIEIRKSQDLLQKQLPPRSKNSSHSNRTGLSNQSTTNQSFSSNPQGNNSLECPSLKAISANIKQNQQSSENYLKDLLNQNINPQQNDLARNEQRLYSQDTIFSQRFRKNSFDQEQRTIVHQNSNELIAYGEPQKTIHNDSQEKLDTKVINDNTISQEFLLNKDTFLDNLQDQNEQIQMFRVRKSQSFNKK
ncbi:hypothetical protein TTHERM_00316220 (macronuclear) [Tetrahymena thermophila SB210]|uniref:Uncharacterized protein n=1 Tax=Tetrahymena thermophila (strain SB210) TaxID=312017 RepID=I7LW69_TETTS|nr:hypothetical protein TTHERM_00316220 [Tetrahymena thermophila SB210]EAS01069.2 hypothetical protein TTHERM_00316220 [Tetrahymena thermophila SB210]|eukprot:XP_001021314.2 hypothetical protein TTHERM_00316220 [Tetrahymena thermophila SB210]